MRCLCAGGFLRAGDERPRGASRQLPEQARTLPSHPQRADHPPRTPFNLEDAKRVVGDFIEHYNTVRLHSAIGYVAPADRLAGHHKDIFNTRDKRLESAGEDRTLERLQQHAQFLARSQGRF